MSEDVTVADLARDPLVVARSLVAWGRGDADEAVLATLELSSRDLHARAYTMWAWAGTTPDACPVWILPVPVAQAVAFSPRGPVRALIRTLRAAVEAGAVADAVTVGAWNGMVLLTLPGLDAEIAPLALQEAHPEPARAVLAALPASVEPEGEPIELIEPPSSMESGALAWLARGTWSHPVRVALTLAAHGQPIDAPSYPPEMVAELRRWGLDGMPPPPDSPSLAVQDDPCPRRRHARTVLRRLLRMGKVGVQYHTEFDHLYRGAAPEDRRDALEVGEALVRAGLLGEKPSVGQRHVYLRREALPDIHALIDRGQTRDRALAREWTAPAPGDPPEAISAFRLMRERSRSPSEGPSPH